ncbi:hypothetical protein Salat_2892000 [Sesamum alatum]|uniref:Uncharacterized protein n=1 Tax=Sesamum alatum TaxID=300844 RepID=A0AAE1XIM1_9LAMI|nr:hypothetical protein Salat_2892000 [Sesamum alatum]
MTTAKVRITKRIRGKAANKRKNEVTTRDTRVKRHEEKRTRRPREREQGEKRGRDLPPPNQNTNSSKPMKMLLSHLNSSNEWTMVRRQAKLRASEALSEGFPAPVASGELSEPNPKEEEGETLKEMTEPQYVRLKDLKKLFEEAAE